MHDRNGTPLHPGDWAHWIPEGFEDDPEEVEVMREGSGGIVVVAFCIDDVLAHRHVRDALSPATIAALDQTDARARDEGAPEGCWPMGVPSDRLEKLEDDG
jgi:hypothetical protein